MNRPMRGRSSPPAQNRRGAANVTSPKAGVTIAAVTGRHKAATRKAVIETVPSVRNRDAAQTEIPATSRALAVAMTDSASNAAGVNPTARIPNSARTPGQAALKQDRNPGSAMEMRSAGRRIRFLTNPSVTIGRVNEPNPAPPSKNVPRAPNSSSPASGHPSATGRNHVNPHPM